MEFQRFFLYVSLAFISFVLWNDWEQEHITLKGQNPSRMESSSNHPSENPPISNTSLKTTSYLNRPEDAFSMSTKDIKIGFNKKSSQIVTLSLNKYPESLHSKNSVVLLNPSSETPFLAESFLIRQSDSKEWIPVEFEPLNTKQFESQDPTKEITVSFQKEIQPNISVQKIYHLKSNGFLIGVEYKISNKSNQSYVGKIHTFLKRLYDGSSSHSNQNRVYEGAAFSSPSNPYEKITFDKMKKENFSKQSKGGWAAFQLPYFISAWIPDQSLEMNYSTQYGPENFYTVSIETPELVVGPSEEKSYEQHLYVGPMISEALEKAHPTLPLSIDYGYLWFISIGLLWLLKHCYFLVGNWGWAIVLVTLLVKVLFYKLSEKSYRSMSQMKKLQPKIEQLRERCGEDKQKMGQEVMALYRKEKINPLGGCLPILVQIPVFLGLYWVLIESVELRQAPFMGWILDLSEKDPYFILPILMGFTMFIQQQLNPPPPDPVQAKVMMFLPLIFTVFFFNFPAGLVLYWLMNSVLSLLQQWYIMSKLEKRPFFEFFKKKAM